LKNITWSSDRPRLWPASRDGFGFVEEAEKPYLCGLYP